jgi:Xaa-Pro aminopeptidase
MTALRDRLRGAGVDALLVTNLTNVRYLTGFSGTNGQVLVWDRGSVFLSDPRYSARAAALVEGAEVAIYPDKLTDLLPAQLERVRGSRLGFEADTMTVAGRDRLAEELAGTQLVATWGVVEELRRAKDDDELAAIRRAVELADDTFAWILDRLAPGRTERAVALDLEVRMRREGADDASFEPIVGSGALSAHIHHTAGDKELARGDLVLLDFGSVVDGYCSDLTRTVVLGTASDEQNQVYATVLRAQLEAIDAVGSGARGAEVDGVARALISDAGHGDGFDHGLGHGVGLDIHEPPRLHRTSEDTLVARDVVTIEPGVYRAGWGGIRIEDCVVVTDGGAEVLGRAPKDALVEVKGSA